MEMEGKGSRDQRKPTLQFRPNSKGGPYWDPHPARVEQSTRDSHGHRLEERSREDSGEGSALACTQTAGSELTHGPREEWRGEVGDFLDSTHTAVEGPATSTQGASADGFEPMVGGFEDGVESDHEGLMEETRSEWDDRDSSEGAQLSESSATNSEVFIHEPDWGEMYLRCPR